MKINPDYLEEILLKSYYEDRIVKIISTESTPGAGNGCNYMGVINRIKMDVLLQSGKKKKLSIIRKNIPKSKYHREMVEKMALYRTEIKMYEDIIPKMEDVFIEFGDTTERMWAEMITCIPHEEILLYDLVEEGYISPNRKVGLDLEHSLLVMRSLAKFHATSVILKERGLIPVDIFQVHAYSRPSVKDYLPGRIIEQLKKLLVDMETVWEIEWHHVAKQIRKKILPRVGDIVTNITYEEDKFNVMNHGDFYTGNMMFKYGIDSVTPISVKFVDLQFSFYNTPAYDLQYFLTTSTNLNVKKTSIDHLLHTYHTALVDQLNLYSYAGHIITYENLKQEFLNKNLYGFLTAVKAIPFLLRDDNDDDFPNFEEMYRGLLNNLPIKVANCYDPSYPLLMKDVIKRTIMCDEYEK